MLQIQKDVSLLPLNTFGMKVSAAYFSAIADESEIPDLYKEPAFANGLFLLGGGSNILFTGNVQQWVLHNRIKGIAVCKEDDQHIWLRAGGGEIWHDFVCYCVQRGYGGIENLSLIPGTVGAAPIQNIGAYGAEVRTVIEEVRAWHFEEKEFLVFSNAACCFGYRDSVFKRALKEKVLISSVVFRLDKNPVFNISYGGIKAELEQMKVAKLSLENISQAVMRIRSAKLPDPKKTGNAGSFFKNPEITTAYFEKLQLTWPGIPGYRLSGTSVKIPAAWLIEQCGWKGFRQDNYGVHPNQPLVLVNYGNAEGAAIARLSRQIRESVQDKFAIDLETEVRIY